MSGVSLEYQLLQAMREIQYVMRVQASLYDRAPYIGLSLNDYQENLNQLRSAKTRVYELSKQVGFEKAALIAKMV